MGARTLTLLAVGVVAGCGGNSTGTHTGLGEAYDDPQVRASLRALSPDTLPPPPPDISNRFADNPQAALLGQKLFFDRGFSGPLLDSDNDGTTGTLGRRGEVGKVACADCHNPTAGFSDRRTLRGQISLGAGWGARRARSLLDVGQAKLLMWDGRRDALYNQPFTPVETAVELNSSRLFVAEQIFARYRAEYEALFGPMPPLGDASRFPPLSPAHAGCEGLQVGAVCHGVPGDRAEFDSMSAADQEAVTRVAVNFGKALGAYERRLSCGGGRFDQWIHGDEAALSVQEKRGAALFVGARAGCSACHSGPFLSDQTFHNMGLEPTSVALFFTDRDDRGAAAGLASMLADRLNVKGPFSDGDDGRIPARVLSTDEGAFRTPSLRCVSGRPSFMHTGQIRTLDDTVSFFNRGGDTSGFLGTSENTPRSLSADEEGQLVAFLKTLDGPGPAASLLRAP